MIFFTVSLIARAAYEGEPGQRLRLGWRAVKERLASVLGAALCQLGHRHAEAEGGADADFALQLDRSAVDFGDVAHDGEAEPGAAAGEQGAGAIGAVEALEDAALLGRLDTHAGVAHVDPDHAGLRVGPHVEPRVKRGEDLDRAAG